MLQTLQTRNAKEADSQFLYQLKKQTEFQAIKDTFGWDDKIQWDYHLEELQKGMPTIVMHQDRDIGSFLIQDHSTHREFARFFILPEYQGQGFGREILLHAFDTSLPIKLSVLKVNPVLDLYRKFGFEIESDDQYFFHMIKPARSV